MYKNQFDANSVAFKLPRAAKGRRGALRLGTCLGGTAAILLLGSLPAIAAPTCGILSLSTTVCPPAPSYSPDKKSDAYGAEPTQDLTVHRSKVMAIDTHQPHFGGVVEITGSLTGNGTSRETAGSADVFDQAANRAVGDLTISVGSVITHGNDEPGILTVADGTTSIKAGAIETTGDWSSGIHASGNGDISIDVGVVKTVGYRSDGIYASTNAGAISGGINVTANEVSTAGFAASGIRATSYGGSTTINAGTVTTSGYGSDGVYASSYLSDVTVEVASLTTSGGASRGVVAYSGSTTTVKVGDITTGGAGYGIHSDAGAIKAVGSAVTVESGDVSTRGDYSAGIYASSNLVWSNEGHSRDISVTAGDVSTGGFSSDGIDAVNIGRGGNTTIEVGDVTTKGDYAFGIFSYNQFGDTTIKAGNISTNGFYSRGIHAEALQGNLTITGESVSTGGDQSYGVIALVGGTSTSVGQTLSIDIGNVSTQGKFSYGVVGVTLGNQMETVIDVGSVKTTGDYAHGIYAYSAGTDNSISINAGSVETAGANSVGIVAVNTAVGGNVALEVGSVKTTGQSSTGIFAYTFDGDVTINTGTVDGAGIGVSAIRGDVTINAGSIRSDHYEALGISASGKNVAIDVDDVEMTGSLGAGIVALAAENVAVNAGHILTTGESGFGIVAEGTGVTVTAGNISTFGLGSDGIYTGVFGSGNSFDITVNEGINTFGDISNGITAVSGGTGAIHNNGHIATYGYNSSNGILALGMEGITLDGHDGSVATYGANSWGILTYALGGDIAITQQSVLTRGPQSVGVYANIAGVGLDGAQTTGDISIDVDSIMTVGATSDALVAFNQARGDININAGAIVTSGNGSMGILAYAAKGDVNVTVVDVSTTGKTVSGRWVGDTYLSPRVPTGIYAVGQNVTVVSTGVVSTEGDDAGGVYAAALGGKATIHVNSVSSHGRGTAAVRAYSAGGGIDVTTTGTISASGFTNSYGILAFGSGPVSITNTGLITVETDLAGKGIYATTGLQSGSPITIMNAGKIQVSGVQSSGIDVTSRSGDDVSIASSGLISVSGDFSVGVAAIVGGRRHYGKDAVQIGVAAEVPLPKLSIAVSDVQVSGKYATGVGFDTFFGITELQADHIVALGQGSNGISGGGGEVDIKTNSIVADGVGIFLNAGHATLDIGDITAGRVGVALTATNGGEITVHGSVVSKDFDAIETFSPYGAVTVNVLRGATVTGGGKVGSEGGLTGPGTTMYLFAAKGVTVNNAGTVNNKGDGYTIVMVDTLDEQGNPIAGGFGSAIHNSGLIEGDFRLTSFGDDFINSGVLVAAGDSDFGGGEDHFANSGTLLVRDLKSVAPEFAPTSVTFNGLERFENSGTIDLRGGAVGDKLTLTGGYVGAGNALLALDVQHGASDRLVIEGAATGSTGIVLNQVAADATLLTKPLELVKVGAGSSATAFHMAQTEVGLVHYSLGYDAGSFQLRAQAGAGVYRLAKLGEGASGIWDQSAQAWSSHMAEIRDDMGTGSHIWGQAYGGVVNSDQSRNIGGTAYRLDYRQNFYGFQVGADLGGSVNDAGATVFGVTAGYISSRQNFDRSAERSQFDTINLGAYASFKRGVFFTNVLAQYDHHSIDVHGRDPDWSDKTGGDAYGLQGEIGARLGSETLFVEPLASLAWQKTSIDNLDLLNQSLEFGNFDGLTGKLGARIGGKARVLGADAIFYAKGNWVHQFNGEGTATLFSGGATETVQSRARGDYGQAALGVNISSQGPVSGFVEGNASLGSSSKGGGGRVGMRFKF
ncbi:pertactin-like passenger domain-containing protein [Novosphingobium sp. AP12]|uniref:pertactin-like passenger domain-containing protein n=1 Tax=Novosphingobium sp. AP12 TaxID=1144305 RepID=UPI000271E1DE|nr:pertactin-like passenger domain-containing protein [Novosphingobium sp. AP12]EJL35390.1 Pertactin [Novosphingobium sp. AP12]